MATSALNISRVASFSFDCPLPKEGYLFIKTPPVRGTLDIAWSCFAVLILSTWETLLFNVPRQVSATNVIQTYKIRARRSGIKAGIMLVTLLAPEFMFALAVRDVLAARQVLLTGKDWANRDGVPWTFKHAYFIVVHGFEAETVRLAHTGRRNTSRVGAISNAMSLSLNQDSNYQARVSFLGDDESSTRTLSESGESEVIWPVNGAMLLSLRTKNWIKSWPNVSTEDLNDKDKGDNLIKVLAIVQILWLTTQVFTRLERGLPTTQLEFVVVAYAAMSLLIRAISWQRPRDIHTTIRIQTVHHLVSHEIDELRQLRNTENYWVVGALAGLATGTIFGGLHYLAWNQTFPTPIEKLLWRISVLATVSVPAYMPLLFISYLEFDEHFRGPRAISTSAKILMEIVGLLVLASYVLARVFTIVEAVRSLFFQPPEAFISTWAGSFPHFA